MTPSSTTPTERARKMYSVLLQRLQGSATSVAASMGVSESTVSRLKTDHAEQIFQVAAHCGLKLVDESRVCVRADEIAMLRRVHALVIDLAPHLLNEDET